MSRSAKTTFGWKKRWKETLQLVDWPETEYGLVQTYNSYKFQMLSIVYVQLQCHGYGLQITVNGPLRALLTSDPRQGHEETGGLIASDCFIHDCCIQLIPFHSAYLFLLFSFFCATGLQSRHGAARQLESVLDWSDWRTRSDRFTIGAEATNKMFAVTWLEYNKMYCPPAPVREDKRRSVSSGMDFGANWISKHVFKQEEGCHTG